MKRFIILFLTLGLFAHNASAQYGFVSKKITSNSMSVKKIAFDKTFYFAAGGQLNTATESHFKFSPGYEVAFGYQMGVKRQTQLGSQIGFELGLTSRGWKYEQFYTKHHAFGHAVFLSPINYIYRIGVGKNKNTWIEPHIGAFVLFNINKDTYRNVSERYLLGNEGYIISSVKDLYGTGYTDDDYPPLDYGVNVGLRIWLAKRVSMDISYRQGFYREFADEEFTVNYPYYSGGSWHDNVIDKAINHEGMSGNICLRIGVKLNK